MEKSVEPMTLCISRGEKFYFMFTVFENSRPMASWSFWEVCLLLMFGSMLGITAVVTRLHMKRQFRLLCQVVWPRRHCCLLLSGVPLGNPVRLCLEMIN